MLNKKELLKKLLEGEEDPKLLLKKYALKQASALMSKEIADSMQDFEKAKPKASVTVATDDPKKLPEALEKAKELSEDIIKKEQISLQDLADEHLSKKEMPEEEEMDEAEKEEEVEDELNLDELSPEELKKLLKKLL